MTHNATNGMSLRTASSSSDNKNDINVNHFNNIKCFGCVLHLLKNEILLMRRFQTAVRLHICADQEKIFNIKGIKATGGFSIG